MIQVIFQEMKSLKVLSMSCYLIFPSYILDIFFFTAMYTESYFKSSEYMGNTFLSKVLMASVLSHQKHFLNRYLELPMVINVSKN